MGPWPWPQVHIQPYKLDRTSEGWQKALIWSIVLLFQLYAKINRLIFGFRLMYRFPLFILIYQKTLLLSVPLTKYSWVFWAIVWSSTGDKQHKCKFCNKSFESAVRLKIHLNIHTGEKAYKCHVWNHFHRVVFLKNHTRTNTRGKHTNVTCISI